MIKIKMRLSEQLKNVTKISTGTIMGQIICIVTLPIITRLYGAKIIGIWTTINAIANIIQNFCDLGISNALMLSDEKKVNGLHLIVTRITMSLSVISGGVVLVYFLLVGQELQYSLMICICVAVYSFTLKEINTCYIILNRNKKYDVLMKNPMIRFSSVAIISILLGVIGMKESGYLIGNIFGQIFTLFHMKRFLPKFRENVKFKQYITTIVQHKNYVKYQMPASIAVTLRTELPNILIGALFGNTILGYFSISQKLLTIPVTFLGQSLGKVFYQSIASMHSAKKSIRDFVNHNIKRGMILALIPMIFFAAFGDVIVTIFFGMEYSVGGIICRIIVYRSLFNFISSATQGLDIVLDKQQYVLYTCLLQTIFAVGSVFIGYYIFNSIYIVSILLVITFIIVQIWYFCVMYSVMRLKISDYLRNVIGTLMIMIVGSWILRKSVLGIITLLDIDLLNQLLRYFC